MNSRCAFCWDPSFWDTRCHVGVPPPHPERMVGNSAQDDEIGGSWTISGQIMTTSHDLTPKGSWGMEFSKISWKSGLAKYHNLASYISIQKSWRFLVRNACHRGSSWTFALAVHHSTRRGINDGMVRDVAHLGWFLFLLMGFAINVTIIFPLGVAGLNVTPQKLNNMVLKLVLWCLKMTYSKPWLTDEQNWAFRDVWDEIFHAKYSQLVQWAAKFPTPPWHLT